MTERTNIQNPAARGSMFGEAVAQYADRIADNFRQHVTAQPEDQLKTPVGDLISKAGAVEADVRWRTEVTDDDVDGRPDLGITRDRLLVGHVELKRPGTGARAERFTGRNGRQWKRFKALPNLIYTDGSEWSLYRSGDLASRVRIADDVSEAGAVALNLAAVVKLDRILIDFLQWNPVAPGTARGLAEFIAPLTRILRDEVRSGLERGSHPLETLVDEWSGLLFPKSDHEQFADAYAQTLTYAMLLARFEGAENLRPAFAADALRGGHALLAQAMQLLEADPVREELKMPIELLERAIGAVDASALLTRPGGQQPFGSLHETDDDPWLYFYEHFLAAYDPVLRKNRGVYYTPVPVVRAQVRLTAELLRERLNKRMEFADDAVDVLDPACGTGAYPLAVIEHAAATVRERMGPGAVPEKLREVANRLIGFELLVGPYSVAHLRIAQRLQNLGVSGGPANVYLTDTLESPNAVPEFTASIMQQQLTLEHEQAQSIKKNRRVLVCLGNPPYDRETRDADADEDRRKGGWVRYGDEGPQATPPILEDFLAPAREAGAGIHLKSLYNDYVYFWRWALWKVFDSTGDAGVVTFITASSYLSGPGFVGMRRKMREVFDELWIIDLEGDSLGARKTENVFAIRTPVAIAIGVRDGKPRPDCPATVWKTKLTGSEAAKLDALDSASRLADFDWRRCADDWGSPFYPAGSGTYFEWPKVTDLFPWQQSGVQLKRTWPIGATRDVLERRWRAMLAEPASSRGTLFRETRDRTIHSECRRLVGTGSDRPLATLASDAPIPAIGRYAYRSFNRQYVMLDARLGDRNRPVLHRAHGNSQIYLTSLLTKTLGDGPGAMASADIPDLDHLCGRGAKDVIPLWRDSQAKRPNVTAGLLELLEETYGVPVSPRGLFAYAYGLLAQPAYVKRFWDELELPPPRLPLTKNARLFSEVTEHGSRLLYLHTYGERFGGPSDDGSVPQGAARCTKGVSQEEYPADFSYDPQTETLRVGDGEFAPVSPEAWSYSISGLQVVKSWLGYRKRAPSGRKSSLLDEIRPERWEFAGELLELLWVLEATLEMQPRGAALLEEVCASPLFSVNDLPSPSAAERQPPR